MSRSYGHGGRMQDRFGVPDSMFGSVPEDFYDVVGRIVLVATMVEDRTLMVLVMLANKVWAARGNVPWK